MNHMRQQQRGAVLIISLILLVVLTLLGLSAMRNTSLEESMAGNMRAENVAFQAAEAALRNGEEWLTELTAKPLANGTGSTGIWLLDAPDADDTDDQPWWRQRDAAWWAANGEELGDDVDLTYLAGTNLPVQPLYIIEERGVKRDSLNVGQQQDFIGLDYYQVTARGLDMSQRSEVFVRSTFARRF